MYVNFAQRRFVYMYTLSTMGNGQMNGLIIILLNELFAKYVALYECVSQGPHQTLVLLLLTESEDYV